MLNNKTNQQKQINEMFAAIKTGKFNKILDAVNQQGIEALAFSRSANSETFGTMIVKKGLFYKMLKALLDKEKIDTSAARQLINTYLPKNSSPALRPAIDKELQQIANDAALEHVFMKVMVDQVSENMEPFTKELLFNVVKLGDTSHARHLLKNSPRFIYATDSSGNLAHAAAQSYNASEIIQTLKSFGVDLNYLHERMPPILSALQCGNFLAVEAFIKQGVNLNMEVEIISKFLFTFSLAECALYFMLSLNKDEWPTYLAGFRLILKQNVRVDIARVIFMIMYDNNIEAIKNCHNLSELMECDVNLSEIIVAEPKSNLSLIQIAAKYKKYEILKILIEEFKLSVDLTYKDTTTALCIILSHHAMNMADYLLKQNPNLLKKINGIPFLHLFLQSMPAQSVDFLKILIANNYPQYQRLLNTSSPVFQKPTPNQDNQTRNYTPMQIAILIGDENLIAFLLSLDFIEKRCQPSLIQLLILQHNSDKLTRLISLFKQHNLLPELTDIGDISFFSNEKKQLFYEYFPWQEPTSIILTESTKEFTQHIQRAWTYHRLTKTYDAGLAKKIDAFIRNSLSMFYDKHKTEFNVLSELMWLFCQANLPQEAQIMQQWICVYYDDLPADDETKQLLLKEHQAVVENILKSIFNDLDDLPKEAQQANAPMQEHPVPVIKQSSSDKPYYYIPIPEKIMTGYAFIRERLNLDSAGIKQYQAESKFSTVLGQYPGRLFPHEKKLTKERRFASWLCGKLTEDDSRVVPFENKEGYFIFISDEVPLLGTESQKLMGKSRWRIGPTNAVKKLKAPQEFTLNLNQEGMTIFFEYEICSKSTADRILCGVLRDEAGNRLMIPCYYQANGLHDDNQPSVSVISMEITLNRQRLSKV